MMAYCFGALGDWQKSASAYRSIPGIWSAPSFALGLAEAELRCGNLDEARTIVATVEISNPNPKYDIALSLEHLNKELANTAAAHRDGLLYNRNSGELGGNSLEIDAKSTWKISAVSLLFCLVGCSYATRDGCGSAYISDFEFEEGVVTARHTTSSEEDRVRRCQRIYSETERQRKEELSHALEERMNPTQAELNQ